MYFQAIREQTLGRKMLCFINVPVRVSYCDCLLLSSSQGIMDKKSILEVFECLKGLQKHLKLQKVPI